MAEFEKFKDEAVSMLLKHSMRELSNDSNIDIIEEKSILNRSIKLGHGGKSAKEYYHELVGNSYLYGRGSKREKDAITCCSCVVTLPKEISDYSTVKKDQVIKLNEAEENAFFMAVFRFISTRYGKDSVIKCDLHYDEAGQPHMHTYLVMRQKLCHDNIRYKTEKVNRTSNGKSESWKEVNGTLINRKGDIVAKRTNTGRWEYVTRFKHDENGNRIPLKNYSKMSDYYEYELAANKILNPIELRYFHKDLADYLSANNVPGAKSVNTGVTSGKSISVKTLKEFTRSTGLTLDQVRDMRDRNISLEKVIGGLQKEIDTLSLSLQNKDRVITELEHKLQEKDREIDRLKSDRERTIESDWGKSTWDNDITW